MTFSSWISAHLDQMIQMKKSALSLAAILSIANKMKGI
jgi:hypothetical protein